MAKFNFYAIKRGFNKDNGEEVSDLILTDWSEAKPLVIGYENARYKGFLTKGEAEIWLSMVDRVDAEKRGSDAVEAFKKDITDGVKKELATNSSKTVPETYIESDDTTLRLDINLEFVMYSMLKGSIIKAMENGEDIHKAKMSAMSNISLLSMDILNRTDWDVALGLNKEEK